MGEEPKVSGYPAHWEADVVLRDGAAAQLRPVGPEDAERLQRMHAAQSESSIYLRYFTYKSKLSEKELERFTSVDHRNRVSLVVLLDDEIIGVGGYDRIDDTGEAEVSFNISDKHQGRGLGSILLEHLAAAGRECGIERFSAEVLPENRKMLTVFSEAGYEVQRKYEDGVVLLEFSIDPTERSRAVMESREHRAEARSVGELLAPAQVAVIGASREYGSVGYHLLQNLIEGRFTGGVHSVNPEAFEVGGAPAYSSLAHIKQQIDLAVVAVPAHHLPEVIADCGRHGVKSILVVTSTSTEQQRDLVRLARRWGMRIIGPASAGLINTDPDISLNASLSPTMPVAGGVGLFSQSASMGVSLYAQAHRRELGLSAVISAGNRADLSGNDAMQYFEDDHATRAVGVYLESFGNPRKFSRIARRLSLSKPVVVATSDLMGHRLPPGHEVRLSRAPKGAVDAMLKNSGVIQVGNHDSLMDVLQVLGTQPMPAGNRLGVLTNSASMSRLLADAGESQGLKPTTIIGDVDLDGTQRQAEQNLTASLAALFEDDEVDAVAVCLQPTITGDHFDHSRAISMTARQYTKPMVMSLIGTLDANVPLNYIGNAGPVIETSALQQGVPIFSSPARSISALAKITRYQSWRARGVGETYIPEGLEGTRTARETDQLLDGWLENVDGAALRRLNQEETRQLLNSYGIALLPAVPFDAPDDAAAAAEQLGYPVAVKSTNVYLRHRLDLGGVQLNIDSEDMLRRVVADMRRQLAKYGSPGLEVQAMAPTGQACIVRAIEDPMMGPVLSFGISGDAVDLLNDWAHAVPPLTDQDLSRLLSTPKASRKLFGYQGIPAVDFDALGETVQRVAMLKDNHPQVANLQLSPLLASPEGVNILHAGVDIANPEQRTDSARRAISQY
ncbi:bifunctional acetate--CoA ligase family protein/GNAT family N-acetyltransferase [Nesterenkonia ebinurensis]|uniref:bifunctional acetate--CoA ligase family protein/GNAT family N-acetyltransferase n=1 Tax=Nesterenkonia ebinurensis TaxID=2608252 RepID=UPI00123D2474|nr:bifunctional GNAT family N-acetyltransferase/acetate--CoA ligase family protein [Nesterenkonia ebinurensis]